MYFHSPNFLVFFLLLLVPFYLWKKARISTLAVADVIFYGASGLGVLVIFVIVTALTFLCVHWMRREGWHWVFWVGIGINVLNLAFFKYTIFFLASLERLTGYDIWFKESLAAEIVLPVGISFYTFQLISYVIDVRRGTTVPTKSFLSFWVYISLFPQLVAGPIMRGSELIPQLDELKEKEIRWQEIKYGILLFFVGLVKKVVFADPIATIANSLFAKGDAITAVEAWLAAYSFGFQIYFDFSAYSDMALGLGYILGIKLIINFNAPYISSNPSEFWQRWHISLSRWIRDYIYIGLGGNRKGPVRVQFNLFAAMLISGLWHGAMWTFVLWGAIHGLMLILYKWTLALNRWKWIASVRSNGLYRAVAILVFFHIITWTWVFFRAPSVHQAFSMTKKMMRVDWWSLFHTSTMLLIACLYLLHVLEYLFRNYEGISSRVWHGVPFPIRSIVYGLMVFILIYYLKGETYEFIYFQF